MSQQSKTGFGVANPVPYAPKATEEKESKKEDDDFPQSLEEALLGE